MGATIGAVLHIASRRIDNAIRGKPGTARYGVVTCSIVYLLTIETRLRMEEVSNELGKA